MISIPDVLKDCRFIIVSKKQKRAFEEKWQLENNYSINDSKLTSALKNGYNYGVLPSGNICIFDADEPEILQELGVLNEFNDTFTVKSGSGDKYHFYFKTDEGIGNKKKVLLHPETGEHLGEIYPPGCPGYCVGSGSIHPSGNEYIVFRDNPLKFIPSQKIEAITTKCRKQGKPAPKQEQPGRETDWKKYERDRDNFTYRAGLRIEDIAYPVGEVQTRANGEIQGAHPVHGSKTGMNYSINTSKNLWHCWRDDSGGDPAVFIAVREGLMRCEDAKPGALLDPAIMKKVSEVILSGKYGNHYAENLKKANDENTLKWKEARDNEIKALAEENAKVEAEEAGNDEPALKNKDDRNQITSWVHGRSKGQILESGAFYNGDKKAVQSAGDIREVLRDICVYILFSGKNGDACISTLAIVNKTLPDKFSLSELQKIKNESYQVVTYLKHLDESKRDEQTKVSEEVREKAKKIIDELRIKQEFKNQYARIHASDERIAEIILHGFVLQALKEPDVIIHPVLDGERGAGKSSGVDAAMHLLPDEYVIGAGFSGKALFYHAIRDKSVIYLDDAVWKEELGSYIKTYMNDVSKGTPYRTLDTDRKAITLNFPIGCMFIASSVIDSGDDQLLDRQYRLSVKKDEQKSTKHNALITGELVTGQVRRFFTDDDILAIREALRIFRRMDFVVKAPDASRLIFSPDASSRDKEMFKVFLRSVIILNYQQREFEEKDGIIEVTSSGDNFKNDFNEALTLFDLNKDKRQHRLNELEFKALSSILILKECGLEITREAIMGDAGISKTSLSRALNGRNGVGGLLEKIPLMEESQISEYVKETGKTKHYNIIRYSGDLNLQTAIDAWFVKLT